MTKTNQKWCTGKCNGSGLIGIVVSDKIKESDIKLEDIYLKKCTDCGGTGLSSVIDRPDESSFDKGGTRN